MAKFFLLCSLLGLLSQKVCLSQAEFILTKPSNKNIKSWINPVDGILATENTRVYSLGNEETSKDSSGEYRLYEYQNGMKQAAEYLKINKPDVILQPTHFSETSETLNGNVVYPEVLVIIDNSLFKELNATFYDAVEYSLAYWNEIDMMFRNLEQPKIRLHITGIILVEHPDALPIEKVSSDKLDGTVTMNKVGKWLYKHKSLIQLDSYDFAIIMTGNRLKPDDDKALLGKAILEGLCGVSEYSEKISKIAIVTDNGKFKSLMATAHEIGHLFGADHDEDDGGKCSTGNMIMSEVSKISEEQSIDWSQCSLDYFTKSFSGNKFDCVRNRPKNGIPVPRILPGKLLSLNQQCKNLQKPNSTFVRHDNICKSLQCKSMISNGMIYTSSMRMGALTGSPCGYKKFCYSGECFEERFLH